MGSICANCCRRASQAPTALAKIPAVNTYQLPGNTSAVATEITAASIATTKLTRSRNIGTVKAIKVNEMFHCKAIITQLINLTFINV